MTSNEREMKLEEFINHLVNSSEGIKSQDLIGRCVTNFLGVSRANIEEILVKMIAYQKILEVEYIISGKSRSFFLPVNTEIRIGK